MGGSKNSRGGLMQETFVETHTAPTHSHRECSIDRATCLLYYAAHLLSQTHQSFYYPSFFPPLSPAPQTTPPKTTNPAKAPTTTPTPHPAPIPSTLPTPPVKGTLLGPAPAPPAPVGAGATKLPLPLPLLVPAPAVPFVTPQAVCNLGRWPTEPQRASTMKTSSVGGSGVVLVGLSHRREGGCGGRVEGKGRGKDGEERMEGTVGKERNAPPRSSRGQVAISHFPAT